MTVTPKTVTPNTVYFIGAGPGAADLLTLRAKELIERCPVILYAGSLIPDDMLKFAQKNARIINTASLTLEEIITEFETAKANGQDMARLHSGDTALYSAIGEQISALKALEIAYEIVPGVPAFAAAAAALGNELTIPFLNQTVILTRTSKRASAMPDGESLKLLGQSGATLAIHLSASNIDKITEDLTPLYGADCPVVIASEVTWPSEKLIRTTLQGLDAAIKTHQIKRTAIIFVGRALAEPEADLRRDVGEGSNEQQLNQRSEKRRSALYDAAHDRHLKPATK
ncbi:MAG: precorrin-4 C(11)-methyltransferase [Rhodomicrobium sp.]|nr:MAG: precorrin-4 C(11)-methyltransferase [Rhodomicrobium sp.]